MAMAEAEYNTRHTKAILNVLLCVAMTLDLAEGADHPDVSVLGRSLLPSPLVDGFINTAKMSGVVPEGDWHCTLEKQNIIYQSLYCC